MGKLVDLTGQRFGRLIVVKRVENDNKGRAMWLCRCECGGEKVIRSQHLISGRSQSCGCYQKERVSKANWRHGMKKTRLYYVWNSMKQRCLNENDCRYNSYGGRGITIYEEWKNNFGTFREWALANGYRDDLTIDRIDVNGNYEPSNCRWITNKEQQNNTRRSRLIEFNGEIHTIAEWAEIIGVSYKSLYSRIRRNWTIEKALTKR